MGFMLKVLSVIGPKVIRVLFGFLTSACVRCFVDNAKTFVSLAKAAADAYPKKADETASQKAKRRLMRIEFFADGARDVIAAWCKEHDVEYADSILNAIREIAVVIVAKRTQNGGRKDAT